MAADRKQIAVAAVNDKMMIIRAFDADVAARDAAPVTETRHALRTIEWAKGVLAQPDVTYPNGRSSGSG